jgi:hypothetical protein
MQNTISTDNYEYRIQNPEVNRMISLRKRDGDEVEKGNAKYKICQTIKNPEPRK